MKEEIMKKVRRFIDDSKAQMSTIMALVTGAITLALGIIIFANVISSMPAVNDANATAAITQTSNIFYSATNLVVIGLLVLAAVFILAIVQRLRTG